MSFVIAVPELVTTAASNLAEIGSALTAVNAAAALPTTGIVAAAADEVSAAIAALFGAHAQAFQAISAQAAAFHDQFVQTLSRGAGSYASAESANAEQTLLNAINAPTQVLLGRPLIGNGANGAAHARRKPHRPPPGTSGGGGAGGRPPGQNGNTGRP